MEYIALLVLLVCIWLLIDGIRKSSQRLRSFFYAFGAFAFVVVLGFVVIQILMPSTGTLAEMNAVVDPCGLAISIAAPIAAVWAAGIPPRRTVV
jgi:hypothetical protein